MLSQKLGIDGKDVLLLTLMMKSPDISQAELAHKLKLSQPSVNARMRKLKSRGVLAQSVGLDVSRALVSLMRVDFTASDARKVLETLAKCSFFVNGFQMSGSRNVSVIIMAEDLVKIELIVDRYLRTNPLVSNIECHVVVSCAKSFVACVDLAREESGPCADADCSKCALPRT